MSEFQKSQFDMRVETLVKLIMDYADESGPFSTMELVCLMYAVEQHFNSNHQMSVVLKSLGKSKYE